MKNKILISIATLLVSTSSLFAYTQGSIVLYPEAGAGIAGATSYEAAKGQDINGGVGGVFDEKQNIDLYWSAGLNCNYFFNDVLSLMGGLSIDHNSFKFVWKERPSGLRAEVTEDLYRITIPVGVRFQHNMLVGGGLYLGVPVSYEKKYKTNDGTDKKLKDKTAVNLGLFVDCGVNINANNLLVFFRFKTDITHSYKGQEKDDLAAKIRNASISLNASYGFQVN